MNKTRYFIASSVGTYYSTLLNNILYKDKSFRLYNKADSPLFYHPYFLFSAFHSQKKSNFRTDLNFPSDGNSLLFGDSGGFQLATGQDKDNIWTDSSAFNWLEKNADIFPILDRPPYLTNTSNTQSLDFDKKFKECLHLTSLSAKYFSDTRTKKESIILNVLQGRKEKALDSWYSSVSKYPLDGWAYGGGFSLLDFLCSFFYLKTKGEFNRDKKTYFHILGFSKYEYIIYIEMLQHLINKAGIDLVISFDSSYPFKTAAFGNYFLFPSTKGCSQISFSNKWKDLYQEKITKDHRLPCFCPVCIEIDDVNSMLQSPKDFYNLTSAHNLYRILEYKNMIENIVYLDLDEILETSFPAKIYRNLKIIKNAFNIKDISVLEYLTKEIKDDEDIQETYINDFF